MVATQPVDELRFGIVLSRRNIRRAVTRNLVRRVWRELLRRPSAARLGGWQLVLRRTTPWDLKRFPSAVSEPLKQQVWQDLERLLQLGVPAPQLAD